MTTTITSEAERLLRLTCATVCGTPEKEQSRELADIALGKLGDEIGRRIKQFDAKRQEAVADCSYEAACVWRDATEVLRQLDKIRAAPSKPSDPSACITNTLAAGEAKVAAEIGERLTALDHHNLTECGHAGSREAERLRAECQRLRAGHLETMRSQIERDLQAHADSFNVKPTADLANLLKTAIVGLPAAYQTLISAAVVRLRQVGGALTEAVSRAEAAERAFKSATAVGLELMQQRDSLKARIGELEAALKLCRDQHMGCGGRLTLEEVVLAMQKVCDSALNRSQT